MHYHMLSGDHGYMPDNNIPCETKGQAQACACEQAKELRDEGIRLWGNKRDGYEVDSRDVAQAGMEYIQVTTCHEEDCLEGED